MMYWTDKDSTRSQYYADNEQIYSRVSSMDIEMVSYALLAHIRNGEIAHSMKFIRWLVANRNQMGGFRDSHVSFRIKNRSLKILWAL